jgi:response regulator RpfG family c-di-GMP phosphodiesterase
MEQEQVVSKATPVLVVDDEANVADALWQLLRIHHFEVRQCTSAEAALEILHEEHFDVVISDLHMPGMGGVEFLEQVMLLSPTTRRILITAYDSTLLRERIVGLVHAYLPKPFTLRSFIQVVQHQVGELRKASLRDESNEGNGQSHHLLHKIGARLMDRALRQVELEQRPDAPQNRELSAAAQATYQKLEGLLQELQGELQADILFVADALGQVVAEVGYAQNYEQADLVPMVSAAFASIAELGNMVDGDRDAGSIWHREGQRFDLYMVTISRDFYLAVMLGKRNTMVKPGVAWMALKRAATTIRTQVALVELSQLGERDVERALASAIVNDLDSLFTA